MAQLHRWNVNGGRADGTVILADRPTEYTRPGEIWIVRAPAHDHSSYTRWHHVGTVRELRLMCALIGLAGIVIGYVLRWAI